MRVLVTGSAGFIGAAIAERLEADGDEVVRVDVMLEQAHGPSAAPEGTHRLDVRDADSWSDLLRGVDAGLGLAIVKGIVDAHQGEVEVVNVADAADRGCRFVVRLP